MRIFISWSGDVSHHVALHLREWLPVVLPFVETWVSSEDIGKGMRWGVELATQLDCTDSGIICVVPGNLNEPWLNFEAGALSKSVRKARVHPFLCGLEPRELIGPLSQFQATAFTKDDVWRLVKAINSEADATGFSSERLARSFEVCWPDLDRRLTPLLIGSAAPHASAATDLPSTEALSPEELTVLTTIARFPDGLRPDNVSLGMPTERLRDLMDGLGKRGLLDPIAHVYGRSWRLSLEGRRFVARQKLSEDERGF